MYGRIVYESGSPFFPFLPRLFGTTPWTLENPAPVTPVADALRLFWDVTFNRPRFNWQTPCSPLFAVAVLITFVAAFRDRRAAFVAALTITYIAIFSYLPQDSRYLLPLLPLVSVTAATAVASRLKRRVTLALSLIAIAPAVAYAGYRIVRQGLPPATAARRRFYLEERIPEYRALERRGHEGLYVCGGERLRYYAGAGVRGDYSGLFDVQRVIGDSGSSAELARRLRAAGARELLVSRSSCPPEWQRIPDPAQFELVYADAGAVLWRIYNRPRDSALPALDAPAASRPPSRPGSP
ncbi:MAG: hypothetical protein JWO56_2487, partial [Acidobacteria bacterium]|nr:hypothetical protein [Acidobacteriota bacterium]